MQVPNQIRLVQVSRD